MVLLTYRKRHGSLKREVHRQTCPTRQNQFFLQRHCRNISFPYILEAHLLLAVDDVGLCELAFNIHDLKLVSFSFVAHLRHQQELFADLTLLLTHSHELEVPTVFRRNCLSLRINRENNLLLLLLLLFF
jgi:hypothetical protein